MTGERVIRRLAAIVAADVVGYSRLIGASLLYLPKYSPDLNPIENAFAKFKAALRRAAERSTEALWQRIGKLVDDFTPQQCANYFKAAGYAPA
jgi:transposase